MDLRAMAARQLDDYDNHHPGLIFAEPDFILSVEQSYELQFEVARLRERRGERVAGYKIGCVSHTMQYQLGLDRPVFGHVWGSEQHASGCVLGMQSFDGLAVEGEFAVRLAADVPSAEWFLHHPEVLIAGFVVIELHNYVFRGSAANRAAELIANNAIHAGVVLPVEETPLRHADALLGAALRVLRGGELLGEATGRQLDDGPVSGIARLVEHLAQHGRRLRRGQLVLTGSPLPLWRVTIGDCIEVQCNEFGKVAKALVEG
jgi:2-keto-4-pentenoate hydratase